MPTFHLVSSTIRLNGGILAGSLGRYSVQSVRNRDCRSSSPEKCMRDRISVLEDGEDHGLNVSVYHDRYHPHHREVLSTGYYLFMIFSWNISPRKKLIKKYLMGSMSSFSSEIILWCSTFPKTFWLFVLYPY